MFIKKSRVLKIDKLLRSFQNNEEIYIGLADLQVHAERLCQIGFTAALGIGEKVLPASVGIRSNFNAEGREIVRDDLPMETAYALIWWEWQDWGGYTHGKWVDRPYQRYPREFVPPPSEELLVAENANGHKVIVSRALNNSPENHEAIRHVVNLFLELFGECEILRQNLQPVVKAPVVRRLNWEILPKGEYPWKKLKASIRPILKQAPEGNLRLIERRLEKFSNLQPSLIALGHAGFNGYLVFCFPDRNLYILESIYYGNATYVLREDWERLSQMTKAEILQKDLHEQRIIHRLPWEAQVDQLFARNKAKSAGA